MYVSERSADSICDTALLFLVMKSEYMPSHLGGNDSTSVVFCVACLYIVGVAPVGGVSTLDYAIVSRRGYRGLSSWYREAGVLGDRVKSWTSRAEVEHDPCHPQIVHPRNQMNCPSRHYSRVPIFPFLIGERDFQ